MPGKGKPFGKGQGGRPTGAKNKASRELKEFWQDFFDSAEYRDGLKRRVLRGKAPHMERELHHYAFGKPKDTVQLEGDIGINVTAVRESLAGRIAGLATRLGAGGVAGDAER